MRRKASNNSWASATSSSSRIFIGSARHRAAPGAYRYAKRECVETARSARSPSRVAGVPRARAADDGLDRARVSDRYDWRLYVCVQHDLTNQNCSFLEGVDRGNHQYELINGWHVAQYAYLLAKLKSIREGEATLLDNSTVLFGSGLRDGNVHSPVNLPIVVAGRAGRRIDTGGHITYPPDTPLSNFYLAIILAFGVSADRFADIAGVALGVLV